MFEVINFGILNLNCFYYFFIAFYKEKLSNISSDLISQFNFCVGSAEILSRSREYFNCLLKFKSSIFLFFYKVFFAKFVSFGGEMVLFVSKNVFLPYFEGKMPWNFSDSTLLLLISGRESPYEPLLGRSSKNFWTRLLLIYMCYFTKSKLTLSFRELLKQNLLLEDCCSSNFRFLQLYWSEILNF